MAEERDGPLVCDRLWTQARLATMAADAAAPYGAIDDGVVACRGGRILYAGPRSEAPAFKPVALPAVAAAVQCSRPKAQRPRTKDVPRILRNEPESD